MNMKRTISRLGLATFMMMIAVVPGNISKAASLSEDVGISEKSSSVITEANINEDNNEIKSMPVVVEQDAAPDRAQVLGIFTTKYIVTASVLNVRRGPGTSYTIDGFLYKGDVVKVKEISDGWAKIKFDNKWKYVSAQYLKKQ